MTVKVLAVDDDPTARLIFQAIGQRNDMDIVVVDSGDAALSALRTAQFDVVLMDWRLPGMDGIECIKIIRERETGEGTHTPIIAVTAYAMEGDRERCLAAGADDYISKPFKLDDLANVVHVWAQKVLKFRQSKRA